MREGAFACLRKKERGKNRMRGERKRKQVPLLFINELYECAVRLDQVCMCVNV